MIYSRDFMVRMIEQLNKAIARMLQYRDEEQYDDALDEAGDACSDLLGHQAHMLDTLDPPSVIRTLDKWPKIKVYAALLQAEADVLAARRAPADLPRTERLRRRALQLLLLGYDAGGRGDPDLANSARALLAQVDVTTLTSRDRGLLKKAGLTG